MSHQLDLTTDDDGWDIAECSCGWMSPACPDVTTAAEVWGGHLVDSVCGGSDA